LGIYSCKKENIPENQANVNYKVTASDEFIKSLNKFNDNFQSSDKTPKALGFWSSFSHALFVGAADVVGAGGGIAAGKEIIGAVGLATGGSGAAVVTVICAASGAAVASISANDMVKKSSASTNKWNNNPLPSFPDQFVTMYNIGVIHNDYISKVSYGGISQNDWISLQYSSADDRKMATTALNHTIFNSLIKNQYQPIVNYSGSLDYLSLTKSYKDLRYISPNVEVVLNEFLEVYLRINNEQDLTAIENFYISKVTDKSNGLSDDERMSLLASISVGHHSLEYWYNQN
jgi:hypothetical protein